MKQPPLSQQVFLKRREIEKAFSSFCENKTGDSLDKLALFVFEELAKIHIRLEEINAHEGEKHEGGGS
jgi:hypothetical protein